MKQQREIQEIIVLLSKWLSQIRLNIAIGLTDENKISENVAKKLLNEIYDYELVNLNTEKENFPAIDLGDKTKAKIAFQITSRIDAQKIKGDLETFVASGFNKVFTNGIRFLILNIEPIKLVMSNKV